MLGKLQQIKIEKAFNLFDANKDGFLDKSDIDLVFSNMAKLRHVDLSSPAYQKMYQHQLDWWEEICEAADEDGNGRITMLEYIEFWAGYLSKIADDAMNRDWTLLATLKESITDIFELLDVDNSGAIDPEEYATWMRGHGMSEAAALATFKLLDLDDNGVLTKDEVLQLCTEFYFSNNPEAKGNHFYGVLF